MRIVCPSCQAAYEVPEQLLSGQGKRVRCARCGERWLPQAEIEAAGEVEPAAPAPPVMPPETQAEPDPPPAMAPAAPPPVAAEPPSAPPAPVAARADERLTPEPPPGSRRGGLVVAAVAWLASLALMVGAGWAAVAWRAEIMAAWEASRRLYQWLGLA